MKVENVEKRILDLEGFDVVIRNSNGRDVPGHRSDFPSYPYQNQARNDWTVDEWKRGRFKKNYVGFGVDVLDANGEVVPGQTSLSTVRDTYLEEG